MGNNVDLGPRILSRTQLCDKYLERIFSQGTFSAYIIRNIIPVRTGATALQKKIISKNLRMYTLSQHAKLLIAKHHDESPRCCASSILVVGQLDRHNADSITGIRLLSSSPFRHHEEQRSSVAHHATGTTTVRRAAVLDVQHISSSY